MATTHITPDIDSLSKWEDAFQHPIPTVRGLERQLRASLGGNRDKLRTLVGESYRDLLNTAERIIEMDKSIQQVESHLSTTSNYCNLRLMQRKAENARVFQSELSGRDREKYEFAIQLVVLKNCPPVISRLLQESDMCLLASKVFIVSRLLLKSLSQRSSAPIVDNLRRQMTSLRSVLLRHIDRTFGTSAVTHTDLIGNMAAFSLITSSSCADVLVHFQSKLLDSICAVPEAGEPDSLTLLNAFRVYNRLLVDTAEIFPKRLSDVLLSLKSRTLFADSALKNTSELNLTSYLPWIPEHIRIYTPWVRHDDLQPSKIRSETINKSARAIKALLESTERTLSSIEDIDGLITLRHEVLFLWKPNEPRLEAVGSDQWRPAMDSIRQLFHNRMVAIINKQASELSNVMMEVINCVKSDAESETPYIWSDTLVSCDISQDGGKRLEENILNLLHGEGVKIRGFKTIYSAWIDHAVRAHAAIKSIVVRKKWNTDNADNFEDEFENGDTGASDFDKVDSEALLQEHVKALTSAFERFDKTTYDLTEEPNHLKGEGSSNRSTLRRTSFLVRVLTRVRYEPPRCDESAILRVDWVGKKSLPLLHDIMAEAVMQRPVQAFDVNLMRKRWALTVPFSTLWEGTPPLPVHPSPNVFKLLHRLIKSMSSAGVDIWTTVATDVLKEKAASKIWANLEIALEKEMTPQATQGDTAEADEEGPQSQKEKENAENDQTGTNVASGICQERLFQTVFDVSYLDAAFKRRDSASQEAVGSGSISKETELVEKLQKLCNSKNQTIGAEDWVKISSAAGEYWRRTSLLFGLLNP